MTLPAEIVKTEEEHILPLSDFVFDLIERRRTSPRRKESEYVFPARIGNGYITEPKTLIAQVVAATAIDGEDRFSMHTLRRTFATVAERLGSIPHYTLKRLLNHSVQSDVTAGYVVPILSTCVHRCKRFPTF